jgi:hypothetical protein
MIPPEYMEILKGIGPIGIFCLILFKLWSDWDVKRKGQDPKETTRANIEEIKTVACVTRNIVEDVQKDAEATRKMLTDYLISKGGK